MNAPQAAEPIDANDTSWRGRVRAFRGKHARLEALGFFAGGFIFDAFMVKRIDDTPVLLQQGGYLAVVGVLLAIGLRMEAKQLPPPWGLGRIWRWSDHAMHFLLGTLLNAYMLFYVKSGSGMTALVYFAFIGGLLAINEMPQFHKYGPVILIALYSFCLTSYFAYLIPVLVGHLSSWMFIAAVALALLPLSALARGVRRWSGGALGPVIRRAVAPGLGVQALLVILFIAGLIPPVPLSMLSMGIYHNVEREQGTRAFKLQHQPRSWRFWRNDDRNFKARPGDRVFCFARIFAPKNFHDGVKVRWQFHDPKQGWLSSDAVGLTINGGREEGFGGFSYKKNWTPGNWRVAVETEDGREIGALRFTIESDPSTEPRELLTSEG